MNSSKYWGDIKRMAGGLGFIALLNVVDLIIPFSAVAYMTSVLTSTSIVLFIAAASHLMRKIFFPEISLTELANEAKSHPEGAAKVFMGICIVLSSLIAANVILLK